MVDTTIVEDRSPTVVGCVFFVFFTPFAAAGVAFIGLGIWATADGQMPLFVTPFFVTMGGVFAFVGGAVMFGVLRGWRQRWLRGVPTLTLPGGAPLYPGGVVVARFDRVGGAGRAQHDTHVSAALVGTETAHSPHHHHIRSYEVYRAELIATPDQLHAGSAFITIEVPVGRADPGWTGWSVEVRMRAPDAPDDTSRFRIPVRLGHT